MDTQTPARRIFISLRFKLLIGFTLLFSVVFAAAFYWFYNYATTSALGRVAEDLTDTLLGAAAGIDGDELRALYTEGACAEGGADGCYPPDERYWRQVAWLDRVHQVEPRAEPYTYIKGTAEKEMIFLTSAGAVRDPPFGAKFLERYIANDPTANFQGLNATTLETTPYDDEFGSWISGYTPVFDSKGEVVAALGIDFRADYVRQVQAGIRDQVVLAFVITYAVLFVLVYLVSSAFTGPIIRLTRAADQIGEGAYEQGLNSLAANRTDDVFPDEIESLSEVFQSMVNKVYQREQTLRRQVAELKIEIDEVKRQKQVSEIVDTDFFQDLQAKARVMRERGRRSATQSTT